MGLTPYVVAAMLLILVETAVVVWLLLHRAAGRRAQRVLEDRLLFETLLAELSAKLIHVEAGGIDAALESALRRMVDFLGMDRGNLDEYMDDAPGIRVSCARPGIVELPSILAAEQFPWTADTLRRGASFDFAAARTSRSRPRLIAPATTVWGHARTSRFPSAQAVRCSACCRSTRCTANTPGPMSWSSGSSF